MSSRTRDDLRKLQALPLEFKINLRSLTKSTERDLSSISDEQKQKHTRLIGRVQVRRVREKVCPRSLPHLQELQGIILHIQLYGQGGKTIRRGA